MPANTSGLRYPSHAVRTLLQRHIAPRDASRGNAATVADKGWGMGWIQEKIKNNEIFREGIDRPQLTTISILYTYI